MNFLKKFALKTAENEFKDYLQKLSLMDKEDLGLILGHAYIIISQFVKKYPYVREVINNCNDDKYKKELIHLVFESNRLVREFYNAKELEDAAAMKLWNETFRCLQQPEFTAYGKTFWSFYDGAQKEAKKYLDDLIESCGVKEGSEEVVNRIEEGKEWLFIVPSKFKK